MGEARAVSLFFSPLPRVKRGSSARTPRQARHTRQRTPAGAGPRRAGAGLEEPSEQRTGDRVGRIGHDSIGASRETQVGGVGFHDNDLVGREPPPERRRPFVMQLDGDDAGAGSDQSGRYRAGPGPDVDDELAGAHACFSDEPISPGGVELVPAPPARTGGHDAP